MANYLLLRDNKENGPFSLEDLLKLGLKAYDLVWVEGKSAAWRYPSEINELKPYAPEVEEQPFDRFFKKPASMIGEAAPVQGNRQPVLPAAKEVQPAQEVQNVQAIKTISHEYEAYAPKVAASDEQKPAPKRSVYVTMPGGYTGEKKAVVKPVPVSKTEPAPVPKPASVPIPDYTLDETDGTVSITENPVAKIKFSQPLDEIKEMYVKTLKDRKTRMARNSFMKIGVKRVAVVVGLIGVGLLAGFILRSKPAQGSSVVQQLPSAASTLAVTGATDNEIPGREDLPAGTSPAAQDPATEPPVENTDRIKVDAATGIVTPAKADQKDVDIKRAGTEIRNIREESKQSSKNARPAEARQPLALMPPPDTRKQEATQEEYSAAATDPVTGERNRTVRSANNSSPENSSRTDKNAASNTSSVPDISAVPGKALSGLGDQVSVSSNDYKRVALGGIRNLELTVTNRSKYDLDEVAVEVRYLKPGDQLLKTQIVQFKSVSANDTETVRVPDTNRGVKVEFRIVRIGSSQLVDR